ncbi:MAG: hypothetical protein A3I66_04000 [Burkholderiales bacterium RIFCSPLOWO2_02_FULL_57_36]|nr:MAG: hypothetical protein A3I66_04000 [Burkholderiales bacterium RIFCSPLOWO2_02_FULL_57_36]
MPHIALLENNSSNLKLMVEALIPAGFEVNGFREVSELLAALGSAHFDAALLDAAGIGAEFTDACSGLREHGVPFIVVVAARGSIDNEQALRQGSAGSLERPLSIRGMINVLHSLSDLSKTWQQSS